MRSRVEEVHSGTNARLVARGQGRCSRNDLIRGCVCVLCSELGGRGRAQDILGVLMRARADLVKAKTFDEATSRAIRIS